MCAELEAGEQRLGVGLGLWLAQGDTVSWQAGCGGRQGPGLACLGSLLWLLQKGLRGSVFALLCFELLIENS